jgi:hypothetical protein
MSFTLVRPNPTIRAVLPMMDIGRGGPRGTGTTGAGAANVEGRITTAVSLTLFER